MVMRKLDECKAEVFRRSEERIEKRRKAWKQALVCCVPAVLCIGIVTACLLPRRMDAGTNDGRQESFAGGTKGEITGVEIRGTGMNFFHCEQIFDPDRAALICQKLREYTHYYHSGGNDAAGGAMDGALTPPGDPPNLSGGYSITFFGSEEAYTLSGHELTDKRSGQTYTLTDAQLSYLEELLGLS